MGEQTADYPHPDQVKAWRLWEGYHHRAHSGDLFDCADKTCQVVAECLTEPNLIGSNCERGCSAHPCGHARYSAGRIPEPRNESGTVEYQFSVWPLEQSWEKSLYDLFRQYGRVAMSFTEAEWMLFQASMEHQGFTLREVEKMTPCLSCGREVDVTGPHNATATGLSHFPRCLDV